MKINNKIKENYCSAKVMRLLRKNRFNINEGLESTHALAIEWIRINFNWHFELVWDIINSELVWFYCMSKVGSLDKLKNSKSHILEIKPYSKTPKRAAEEALSYTLEHLI